jgi:CHASE2 domain-containing sensor protein/class 3 adenylate cyclase
MATVTSDPSLSSGRLRALWDRVRRLSRNTAVLVFIGAHLVVAIIIVARNHGWLQPVELLAYDTLRVAWAGQPPAKPADSRIFLIGATDEDIARWGWPLRDATLAEILERVASWRPRAIGVDLYRDIPEPPGTEQLTALQRAHPEIFWAFKLKDRARPGIRPPAAMRGTDQPALADTVTDPGNVVRRGLLFADDGVENYPGMAMALAQAYLAHEHITLQPGEGDDLKLGKALIHRLDDEKGPYVAVDDQGYQTLLDYRGGPEPFPMKSLAEIMDSEALAPLVRDRVVILGITSESVKDFFATPFSTGFSTADPVYGIAVHGHLVDQLLRQATNGDPILTALPRRFEGVWIWLWALSGALIGMACRSTAPAIGATVAGIAALGLIVYSAFGWALLLPFFPAAFAWVGAAGLTNQLLHSASNRARAHLRKSFEHYLAPNLVNALVEHPEQLRLGGETRTITIMFSDIRGFTSISEGFKANPEGLGRLINRAFLTPVSRLVMARRGTIDKFMGDCVMAFWNAPLDDSEHADHACDCAMAMVREMARINSELAVEAQAEDRPFHPINIGVGLNSGECVVGNMGSDERFAYTAMGDAVNLASRLEGQTKHYHVSVIIGETTRALAPRWAALELDLIAVKGKQDAVRIYTLLGDTEFAASAEFRAQVEPHDRMLTCYRRQDWEGAITALAECRACNARMAAFYDLTGFYDLYAERIEFYVTNPPEPDWVGVFVADTK